MILLTQSDISQFDQGPMKKKLNSWVNAKNLDIQTFSDNSSLDWGADPYQYLLETSDYQWVDMQVDEQCLFWWSIRINFSLMEDFISLHLQYVHKRCFLSKISHLVQEKPGRVQYLTNNTVGVVCKCAKFRHLGFKHSYPRSCRFTHHRSGTEWVLGT